LSGNDIPGPPRRRSPILAGALPSLTRCAVRGPAASSGGRRPGREPPDQQISLGLVAPYGGIFASGGGLALFSRLGDASFPRLTTTFLRLSRRHLVRDAAGIGINAGPAGEALLPAGITSWPVAAGRSPGPGLQPGAGRSSGAHCRQYTLTQSGNKVTIARLLPDGIHPACPCVNAAHIGP